jgi:23S rRNA pseudouridine2605 synthase
MRKKPLFQKPNSRSNSPHAPERRTPDRWISKLGLGTRGQAREWIENGRLSVDGIGLIRSLERAVAASPSGPPTFLLDGKPLRASTPLVLAFNKPRGVVSTRKDPEGRTVPSDFVRALPGLRERPDLGSIVPVGRLDKASAGLILLTNRPSDLNAVLDPDLGIVREYRVQVRPAMTYEDWTALSSGNWAKDWGFRPPVAVIERENPKSVWLRMTLTEGKNREIRKPFEQAGYEVMNLVRVRLGPFVLGGLAPGSAVDVTSWFYRSNHFVLDIILDANQSGDIMELNEMGLQARVANPVARPKDEQPETKT